MNDETKRVKTARANDERQLIEDLEPGPAEGGTSGGKLQRDVGTRADVEHEVEGDEGVTRVRAADRPEEADLPRFNER